MSQTRAHIERLARTIVRRARRIRGLPPAPAKDAIAGLSRVVSAMDRAADP